MRKVIFLFIVMMGLCAFFIGMDAIFEHIANQFDAASIHPAAPLSGTGAFDPLPQLADMHIHPAAGIIETNLPLLDLIRYAMLAALLAAALILCMRILKQMDQIMSQKEICENRLHGISQWVQQILDALPVGMVLMDADQTIRQVNKSAPDLLQAPQPCLLQSEKMASIGQLAAGVAHEINNPIGFVKSNLHTIDGYRSDLTRLLSAYETLADYLHTSGPDDEMLRQHLSLSGAIKDEIDLEFINEDFKNAVDESAEGLMRVAKIVTNLKSYSNKEADEAEWVDLNAGIECALNIIWNKLEYKARVTKALGTLPLVRCFPQLINQVIMNVLLNASQAIKETGCIHIVTRPADDHVAITIRDEGNGIPPEHIQKVFDPFFTTKAVGEGTGLGLSVAYNIVQRHKGSIQIDSKLGQGTTVTIRLPVQPGFEESPQ